MTAGAWSATQTAPCIDDERKRPNGRDCSRFGPLANRRLCEDGRPTVLLWPGRFLAHHEEAIDVKTFLRFLTFFYFPNVFYF